VFAMTDPHDIAAGGAARLRQAGIDVDAGVLAADAERLLGPWAAAMSRRRPHLTWKYAATLDGRSAASDGTSQWITGPEARRDVHRERLFADAVIVGIGTVLADDPQLTVRDWPAPRQPVRVVVDTDARTPPDARVVDGAAATIVISADDAPPARVTALRDAGVDVVQLARTPAGLDPAQILDLMWGREIALAYLEGGATLAASFLRAGLVDRIVGYHAPVLLGAGSPVVADLGIHTLADARRFCLEEVTRIGEDVRVVARIMAGSE
jgi:diaminohydroxyphosphoribosylaminopyrimidine deaminase/5-amino-6-(5-phosphoribosylamino)uracil reductase